MDEDISDSDFLSGEDEDDNLDDDSLDTAIKKYYVHHVTCKSRLFGRQKPLHLILGGGFCADVILWRNKEVSAGVLGSSTVIWLLFECIGFGFVTLLCYVLLLSFTSLFLWNTLASFTDFVPPPEIPVITIPRGPLVKTALSLRWEYHRALRTLEGSIFGSDSKRFPPAVAALLILSIVGRLFSLLTLLHLATVTLLTVPVLYESYEDSVDTFAERALIGMRRQFSLFNQNILNTIDNVVS